MGHPAADELLAAVQLFLKEAEAALDGRMAFHARVASNAIAIVRREQEQRPDRAEADALAALGGAAAICAGLRDGILLPSDPTLLAAIRAGVLARLAVDNPRYSTLQRLRERTIA